MPNAKVPASLAVEHITTDDIFGDLGFSPAKAQELRIKSDLLMALLKHIRQNKMTQAELAKALQVHQPDVSNLLHGKLSLFSITKLCQYADRLDLHVRVTIEEPKHAKRRARSTEGSAPRRATRVAARALPQSKAVLGTAIA
jgi:predicted XRE-type DNA-binding protein